MVNGAEYNESLCGRGDLTIGVSEETQSLWSAQHRTARGGQRRYLYLAIETGLTLRTTYRPVLPPSPDPPDFGQYLETKGLGTS